MTHVAWEITHSIETKQVLTSLGTTGPMSPIGTIHQLGLSWTHLSLPDRTGSRTCLGRSLSTGSSERSFRPKQPRSS